MNVNKINDQTLEDLINLTDDWIFVGMHVEGTFILRSSKLDIPYRYYEIEGDLRIATVLERLYDTQVLTRANLTEVSLDYLEYAYPERLSVETCGSISKYPENGMWVFTQAKDIWDASTQVSWLHRDDDLKVLPFISEANRLFREMSMLWSQVLSGACKINDRTYDLTPTASYTLEFGDEQTSAPMARFIVRKGTEKGSRTRIEYNCADHCEYLFTALRLLPEIIEDLKEIPSAVILVDTENKILCEERLPRITYTQQQLNMMSSMLKLGNKRAVGVIHGVQRNYHTEADLLDDLKFYL